MKIQTNHSFTVELSPFTNPIRFLASLVLLSCWTAAVPVIQAQNVGDWQTVPGLSSGYWDNDKNDSAGAESTWQQWNGSAWVTLTGKTPGVDFPSNNVNNVITILPGTSITNSTSTSSLIADEITVSNGAALEILKGAFTVQHSGVTTYDLDVFGSLGLLYSSAGGVILTNGATIAIENGGVMTNFSATANDNFTGPGYNASAITFLNGSLYVQPGSKACSIPLATWNAGSTALFAPSAAGAFFPSQFPGQTFYNFIWNWPTQTGKAGNTGNAGNVSMLGNFDIANANDEVIEDIPGSGGTLTVGGDLGITNVIWYPTASTGIATVNVGGDFTVDSTATIQINNATGIGDIVFDGTSPQALAIYGVNASQGNFNWTVNSGSTVNLNSALGINSGVAGGGVLTDNGTLNLTPNGSISGSANIVIASGATYDVSQASGGYTLAAGQTLSGGGTIMGSVTAAGAAVTHPGGGSTLTFENDLTCGATSTNIFDLSSSESSGNDQIALNGSGGTLTCGGAQIAINSAGTLAASDYVLFNVTGASGSISGSFNPAPVWLGTTPANASNYSIITSGNQVLLHYNASSVPQPDITGISLSGANLVLNGTNGAAGTTYYVLASTNLVLPLSQWTPIETNTLSASGSFTFIVTNTVSPGAPHQFYILQLQTP